MPETEQSLYEQLCAHNIALQDFLKITHSIITKFEDLEKDFNFLNKRVNELQEKFYPILEIAGPGVSKIEPTDRPQGGGPGVGVQDITEHVIIFDKYIPNVYIALKGDSIRTEEHSNYTIIYIPQEGILKIQRYRNQLALNVSRYCRKECNYVNTLNLIMLLLVISEDEATALFDFFINQFWNSSAWCTIIKDEL